MVGFRILAPLLDANSKLATDAIPVGQITAFRFVFQCLCMLPVFAIWRMGWRTTRRETTLLLVRDVRLMQSTYYFVTSVQKMPVVVANSFISMFPGIVHLWQRHWPNTQLCLDRRGYADHPAISETMRSRRPVPPRLRPNVLNWL